jgi:peptidoglycan/LPS O-acetylase OafA/YrhL
MKTIPFKHLSLYQTEICKGIAILFIVIHNVLSKFGDIPAHNEFSFSAVRITQAINLMQAEPGEFFRVFMTFLGHYGVQVFIFLSSYGLVRSIETQPRTFSKFMAKRIHHLILPMLLVITFYLVLDHYYQGIFSIRTGAYDYYDVVKRLLFISNFYPDGAFLVIGPWWFLSLIMQFYCIFLPLRKMQERFGNQSLLMLSIIAILISIQLFPWLKDKYDIYLTATILGHLPEFALGMYVASLDKIKVPVWLIILAVVGLILGNTYYDFWYIAPVCAIIVIMFICGMLFKYLPQTHAASRFLNYMGVLSLYIFLLNGVIREPFIILLIAKGYETMTALLYTAVITVLCIFFAYLFYTFDNALRAQFNKK